MDELWLRVKRELERRGRNWAWFSRELGVEQQVTNNWKRRGIPRARLIDIAHALGWSVEKLTGRQGVHSSQITSFDDPSSLSWESLKMNEALPQRFTCPLPDDALSPETPKGTVVLFEAGLAGLTPGVGVIVQDAAGERHVRIYRLAPGDWIAWARNENYPTLEAKRDGLTILAVAVSRMMDGQL
jgi:hypothetical protein